MLFEFLLASLNRATPSVWIAIASVRGSTPRAEDAGMVVTADAACGTIGGGHLELKATELAREWLRLGKTSAMRRHYPLGPALGQCCGGAVDLLFRPMGERERPWVEKLARAERVGGSVPLTTQLDQLSPHTTIGAVADEGAIMTQHRFDPWHIWIFGAGHVGRALVQVLGTLPGVITWVDSRDAEFPAVIAQNVSVIHSDHPADEVDGIAAGADVLVLTHSHALDLEIVTQLLRRADLAYTGLIGSDTKAQLFRRRLEERGIDAGRMVCPIGQVSAQMPNGRKDKHPGPIAVSVAADLLARRAARFDTPAAGSCNENSVYV